MGAVFAPQTLAFSRSPRAGPGMSNVVDLYNSATGGWSTGQLSIGRWSLAAASVGSMALFAGGWISSAHICVKVANFQYLSVEMMATVSLRAH